MSGTDVAPLRGAPHATGRKAAIRIRQFEQRYVAVAERDAGGDPGLGDSRVRHARRALLWEHLLPWLPVYLDAVTRLGFAPYDTWARLLDRALRAEAVELGPPPQTPPLHLRTAPALPDPRVDSAEAFLAGLLAPVRAGVVVTRTDLQAMAHDLDLGLLAPAQEVRDLLRRRPRS